MQLTDQEKQRLTALQAKPVAQQSEEEKQELADLVKKHDTFTPR